MKGFRAKENQLTVSKPLFDSAPCLEHARGNSGEKNSILTGTNLRQTQNQEGRPSASTGWGLRGQEKGDNKHHNARPGIPAVREIRETQVNDNNNVICTWRDSRVRKGAQCIVRGSPEV